VIYYTWSSFNRDCKLLVQQLKEAYFVSKDPVARSIFPQLKSITAIAVGGLCLGAKLRNLLNLPLIIISSSSYEGKKRKRRFTFSYLNQITGPTLLVDEVVDSGRTMKKIKQYLQSLGVEVITATLFCNKNSEFKPDFYCHITTGWVIMPWER